jgi:hypothetical protein
MLVDVVLSQFAGRRKAMIIQSSYKELRLEQPQLCIERDDTSRCRTD